jgi:hypothetical protein
MMVECLVWVHPAIFFPLHGDILHSVNWFYVFSSECLPHSILLHALRKWLPIYHPNSQVLATLGFFRCELDQGNVALMSLPQ